jgi:hypothetical protein
MGTAVVARVGHSLRKMRRRQTRGQQERALHDPEVRAIIGSGVADAALDRLSKEKGRLFGRIAEEAGGRKGGLACSHAWAEDNWEHGTPYPPGGDLTLMVACAGCGTLTPPNCVGSSGHCDDCRLGKMSRGQLDLLPSSRGIVDMSRLKAERRRANAKKLAS